MEDMGILIVWGGIMVWVGGSGYDEGRELYVYGMMDGEMGRMVYI